MDPAADPGTIIDALDLEPHPEGGFYREVWRDGFATSILFLLRAGEVSAWHRVHGRTEIWHHHSGGPVTLSVSVDGRSSRSAVLGGDLLAGESAQAVVPAGAWQSAVAGSGWALVGCTVAPPFAFEDFEMAPAGWSPQRLGPLVSASWLADRLAGPRHPGEVVVADVRWYLDGRSGRQAFEAGHLPGAVWIDLDRTLAAPPTASAGRHPLPDPGTFAAGLAEAGISDTTTVVAYDDASGVAAGRLVWLLRALGRQAALLDGGLAAWCGPGPGAPERRPIVTGPAPPPRPGRCSVQPWPAGRLATVEEVEKGVTTLLDARGPARFAGEEEPVDPRAGHIPGARNLPYAANLDPSGRFLPAGRLAGLYTSAGVRPGGDVVVYCGSGVSACHDLLALEASGLTSAGRLYAGSWSQWSADALRPAELGPGPQHHGVTP